MRGGTLEPEQPVGYGIAGEFKVKTGGQARGLAPLILGCAALDKSFLPVNFSS